MKLIFVFSCWLLALPALAGYHLEEIRLHQGQPGNCHDVELDTSHWQPLDFGSIEPGQRYCLRAWLLLDDDALRVEKPALKVSLLAAYQMHWNGQWLGNSGQLGDDRATEQPGALGSYHLLHDLQTHHGRNLLSIELSTHHLNAALSMPFHQIEYGHYDALMRNTFQHSLWPFALSGALLLMAVYFLGLYLLDRQQRAQGLFALVCAVCAMLLLTESWKNLFGYRYDWHVIRLQTISALTVALAILLPWFYLVLYRLRWRAWWLLLWLALLCAPFSVLQGYDAANFSALALAVLASLVINVWATWRQRAYSHLNLAAIAGLTMTMLLFPYQFSDFWLFAAFLLLILSMLLAQAFDARQQRQRALQAVRLENELLKRSLQPHFLMNSLTLVMEWIEQQPAHAVQFIEALADEFRLLNHCASQPTIPLTQELQLCRTHLQIMSFRKGRHYTLQVHRDAIDPSLPPALLHTLIENCFSHNRLNYDAEFHLHVYASAQQLHLQLDCPFDGKQPHQGSGIGLAYVRARLNERYGGRWRLREHCQGDRWQTELDLPEQAP